MPLNFGAAARTWPARRAARSGFAYLRRRESLNWNFAHGFRQLAAWPLVVPDDAVAERAQAISLAKEAVQECSGFATALADLGAYHSTTAFMGEAEVSEAIERLEQSLLQALAIAPENANAWLWSARNRSMFLHHWEETERMYRHAMSLAPGHGLVAFFYAGDLLRTLGRNEEVLEYARRGQSCDPLNPLGFLEMAQVEAARGQLQAALAEADQGLTCHPHWDLRWVKGAPLLRLGQYAEAYALLD